MGSTRKIRAAILFASMVLIANCGESSKIMSAEFSSMDECISKMRKVTNPSKLRIMTDKPSRVSGFLSNGEHFSCGIEESGTKGRYVEGWYTIKSK